jgi:hypothetical protein
MNTTVLVHDIPDTCLVLMSKYNLVTRHLLLVLLQLIQTGCIQIPSFYAVFRFHKFTLYGCTQNLAAAVVVVVVAPLSYLLNKQTGIVCIQNLNMQAKHGYI